MTKPSATENSNAYLAMQGLIKGTVQGVFFRASTQRQAHKLGIGGWVRNTREGHVEVCITGAPERIGEMVLWLHRGPLRAQVSAVELAPVACPPITGFEIRR